MMPRSGNHLAPSFPLLASPQWQARRVLPPGRPSLTAGSLRTLLRLPLVPLILLALLATCPAAAAEHELLAKGGFAVTDQGSLDPWTARQDGVRVQQASVISGQASAEILRPHPNNLYQNVAESVSSFVFRMEFAVFDVADGDRSMNVLLYCGPGARSIAVNMRVGAGNRLQAFDGHAWRNLGELRALVTADPGRQGVWEGQQPVVNRLEVTGHLAARVPYYDVTLNGQTLAHVQFFQQALAADAHLGRVQLQALNASGNWLADQISLRPGPEPEPLQPLALLADFLEGPLAGVDEIVFAERVTGFDHYYANFGFKASSVPEYRVPTGWWLRSPRGPAYRAIWAISRLSTRPGARTIGPPPTASVRAACTAIPTPSPKIAS